MMQTGVPGTFVAGPLWYPQRFFGALPQVVRRAKLQGYRLPYPREANDFFKTTNMYEFIPDPSFSIEVVLNATLWFPPDSERVVYREGLIPFDISYFQNHPEIIDKFGGFGNYALFRDEERLAKEPVYRVLEKFEELERYIIRSEGRAFQTYEREIELSPEQSRVLRSNGRIISFDETGLPTEIDTSDTEPTPTDSKEMDIIRYFSATRDAPDRKIEEEKTLARCFDLGICNYMYALFCPYFDDKHGVRENMTANLLVKV